MCMAGVRACLCVNRADGMWKPCDCEVFMCVCECVCAAGEGHVTCVCAWGVDVMEGVGKECGCVWVCGESVSPIECVRAGCVWWERLVCT